MTTIQERFWAKVKKTDTCWLWVAGVDGSGYGRLKVNGKQLGAHRLSWEWLNGPIPPNLCVCHTCDNVKCVNSNHLFLDTHQGNMKDRQAKKRNAYGERSGSTVLTEQQVLEIRSKHVPWAYSLSKLAKEYGVAINTIHGVIQRKTWGHI